MQRANILIVEDEILIASELEAILEDMGHNPVGIAADSKTALQLANLKPDLALVDLNLRDGATGAKLGEVLSRQFHVPVLFVTANPRLLGGGVAGAIGVLTKPYDARIIEDAVTYALRSQAGDTSVRPPSSIRVFEQKQA